MSFTPDSRPKPTEAQKAAADKKAAAEKAAADKKKADEKADKAEARAEAKEARAEAKADKEPKTAAEGRTSVDVHITLRDDNVQTHYDVERLVASLGGSVKGTAKGKKITAEVPIGTDRQPSNARDAFVASVTASPLVEAVEA